MNTPAIASCLVTLALAASCTPNETSPSQHASSSLDGLQLSFGTQTGGSGSEIYCGSPKPWVDTDEAPRFADSYSGKLLLQDWQLECIGDCQVAGCSGACDYGCAALAPPEQSTRVFEAELMLWPVGKVQANTYSGDADCLDQRAVDVAFSAVLDGVSVGEGTGRIEYDNYPARYQSARARGSITAPELPSGVERPSSEALARSRRDCPSVIASEERDFSLSTHLEFEDGAVLVSLSWSCSNCLAFQPHPATSPFASGVLRGSQANPDAGAAPFIQYAPPAQRWDGGACSWVDPTPAASASAHVQAAPVDTCATASVSSSASTGAWPGVSDSAPTHSASGMATDAPLPEMSIPAGASTIPSGSSTVGDGVHTGGASTSPAPHGSGTAASFSDGAGGSGAGGAAGSSGGAGATGGE